MIELVIYVLLVAFIFSRLYNSLGRSNNVNLKAIANILDIGKKTIKEDEDII